MDVERVIDTVTERVLDDAVEPISCPLCGLMPSIVQDIVSVDDRSWSVACLHCRVSATAGTKHDAIILWNDTMSRESVKDDGLKECPFCGAGPINLEIREDENKEPYIYCYGCDSVYYNDNSFGKTDKLIERWNRRK